MSKRAMFVFGLALAAAIAASPARADQSPMNHGPESAAERQFVRWMQADLMARFPHASDAEKAGYIRYTNPDDTGAISYANMQWTSIDARHPSQLWYDRNGDLLGCDFSLPDTDGHRPTAFGVDPGRWYQFDEHVHWIGTDAKTGKPTYDNYVMAGAFVKAGGRPAHPTAATLVKMGKAKSAAGVKMIFDFPKVWDLIVWVRPNPLGAFAYKNPAVKP